MLFATPRSEVPTYRRPGAWAGIMKNRLPSVLLGPDPSTQGQTRDGKQSNLASDDHRSGDRVEHS